MADLPWVVVIWPDYYNDVSDTGYGWSGPAKNEANAVAQACFQCDLDNNWDDAIDPKTVTIVSAEPDFKVLSREVFQLYMSSSWEDPRADVMMDRLERALKLARQL